MFDYIRLKHIILKYYKNQCVQIIMQGVVNTTFFFKDVRVLIDRRKLIFSDNEDINFIIDFNYIEKIKIINEFHIRFFYKDLMIDIQQ